MDQISETVPFIEQQLGSVFLEIRRARGKILTQCVPDVHDRAGLWVDEVSIDLIDDPAEDKLPWAVLSFDFNAGENYGLSTCARKSSTSCFAQVINEGVQEIEFKDWKKGTKTKKRARGSGHW